MKKIFLFIMILTIFSVSVEAQEVYNYEKKADRYYFSYSFDKAIVNYQLVKYLSLSAKRKLADCYHKIDQPILAEKIYLDILNAPSGILPEDYYNYSMACKTNGKYTEADNWMNRFAELKPTDLRVIDYISNKIKLTDLSKNTDKVTINQLAINTDALDFGASYYKNKIVFSSSRLNMSLGNKKYNWTRKPFWNMYVSDTSEGQLMEPILFDENLNENLNNGPASFSNDGNFMAYTRNKYHDRSKDRVVELQIYFSSYQNGAWLTPEPFILNNPNYSVGQPCLTKDGNTMYFTSDMPGGYGKADIYSISKNDKGEWQNAINLGKAVNTEGDDMFPFITDNGVKLFFASDGHFGLGGLDIFSCAINKNGYDQVTNLGAPINTQYNDYGFIINETSGKGYFSSDRIGGKGGDDIYAVAIADPDVIFSIYAPMNIPVQRSVRETFPLRNYIFFNKNETTIPDRYVLLTKNEVAKFSEEQLSVFSYKELANRSKRQLVVYYNVLNILGDRMKKNPSSTITLVGSSENGPEEGRLMATSVKDYLTTNFEITSQRIFLEGRKKPKIPSEQPGGQLELDLLHEGDRRVSVESNFPVILKEFELRTENLVPAKRTNDTSISSSILFAVTGAKDLFTSWSLAIKDSVRDIQIFGPYTEDQISISKNLIVDPILNEGSYLVTMIGQTKYGRTIKKEAPLHVVKSRSQAIEEMMRFSIIFEFDDPESILIYKKYLSEIVIPKIPINGTVILSGYTDIIGDKEHNYQLSFQRMKTVRTIIANCLQKLDRQDVVFEEHWYGEDEVASPFANRFPEERFYNRTVIIDIIPKTKNLLN